jgi:hypothetical protein
MNQVSRHTGWSAGTIEPLVPYLRGEELLHDTLTAHTRFTRSTYYMVGVTSSRMIFVPLVAKAYRRGRFEANGDSVEFTTADILAWHYDGSAGGSDPLAMHVIGLGGGGGVTVPPSTHVTTPQKRFRLGFAESLHPFLRQARPETPVHRQTINWVRRVLRRT